MIHDGSIGRGVRSTVSLAVSIKVWDMKSLGGKGLSKGLRGAKGIETADIGRTRQQHGSTLVPDF
jgi:hypothetical protein